MAQVGPAGAGEEPAGAGAATSAGAGAPPPPPKSVLPIMEPAMEPTIDEPIMPIMPGPAAAGAAGAAAGATGRAAGGAARAGGGARGAAGAERPRDLPKPIVSLCRGREGTSKSP